MSRSIPKPSVTLSADECTYALSWLGAALDHITLTEADQALRAKLAALSPNAAHEIDQMERAMPVLCRWPLCQPEEVQQRIAKEVVDALYGDPVDR